MRSSVLAKRPGVTRVSPEFTVLARTMVRAMAHPAVVVVGGCEVIAANDGWLDLVGRPRSTGACPALGECLAGFSGADGLLTSLAAGGESFGIATLFAPRAASGRAWAPSEHVVRWRQVGLPRPAGALAVVEFEDRAEVQHLISAVDAQRIQIDELLIRQTMIEEADRRAIGQMLHDGLAQTLAQVRNLIARGDGTPESRDTLIPMVDEIIASIRGLAFELSPPVLEEVGLLAALAWLAEHLDSRYQARVTIVSDEREPPLTRTVKTVLFRALRELAINAAKHAPSADVMITCESNAHALRATVRDTGPGFDPQRVPRRPGEPPHFGLVSVERQIRGIGGSFDLYSAPGEGTRTSITFPLDASTGAGTKEPA